VDSFREEKKTSLELFLEEERGIGSSEFEKERISTNLLTCKDF